jgi:anti-anti-sigma regulatory factor
MSDRSFALTCCSFGQASVRHVRAELDVTHASTLGVAIRRALGANPKSFVIDLCGVKFGDVRGLAVLLGPHSARRRILSQRVA